MSIIQNAAPQAVIHGFRDESGRTPVIEAVPVPTNLPLLPLFTQKGDPNEPMLVSGDSIISTFGAETFNPRGKFYMHQHVFADIFRQRQSVMIQRVVPDDIGPPARLLLSLDIVEELLPVYERDSTGQFVLDEQGEKIDTGDTVAGHIARWVVNDWTSGNTEQEFGQVTSKIGGLESSTNEQSTQYPIMELQVSSQGAYGNNIGMRFSAPNALGVAPADTDLAESIKAYLYRISFVQRADENSTAQPIETLLGAQSVDLTFAQNQYDAKSGNIPLSIEEALLDSYQALSEPDMPKLYGPFGKLHVYRNYLEDVLAKIGAAEAPSGRLPELTMDANSPYLHLVNPFTATHLDGAPYESLELKGPLDGGRYLSENTTLYAEGGTDGTISMASYDAAVRAWAQSWGTTSKYQDWAKYPVSFIWDSGFSLETKEALLIPMSVRPDIATVLCTQDVSQPQNTEQEDSSIAVALRAAFGAYPESVLHGTPVARGAIIGQSGYLIAHQYKGLLPLSVEFARMVADYMGAGNGRWNEQRAFDVAPNNRVTMFRDVNSSFKPATVRKRDWDNGLVWAQNYDTQSMFFPAFQTVYDDDTSVLNSFITMAVALEGIKASYRSWRDITGRSGLTQGQIQQEVRNMITADMEEGRFGNRFIIEPEVFFTGQDEQRGYSYSVNIHIYAPNMVTVGTYTVVLHRRSDLEAAA